MKNLNNYMYKKKNSSKKYIEYAIVNIQIMLKILKEYKSNIYLQIFSQIIYLLSYYIIYIVLSKEISIISFSIEDFILYILFIDLHVTFAGIFLWKKRNLKNEILSGNLNHYLTKPLKIQFMYNLSNLSGNALIQFLMNLISLIIFFMLIDYSHKLNFIAYLILILLTIFYYSSKKFCESINFYNFELARILHYDIFKSASQTFKTYPSDFFQKFTYTKLLYIFPNYYLASLLFKYIKTDIIHYEQIFLIIILTLIFHISTQIIWHYGLKKYEAYG